MAHISSLCVYCGSSNTVPTAHKDAAARLGHALAKAGISLVYGGGRVGLMGLMADAALAAGGRVVGVIPRYLVEAEVGHGSVSELHIVSSMHERKQKMFELSDAFAILPGGLGTLDEMFEMLTWRQLRLHDKPIIVVDEDGYWAPLLTLIAAIEADGYAKGIKGRLLDVVDGVDALLPALARAREPVLPAATRKL
ncbi:MAG: TIGR00730 family Rossman fold protein [Alphaproteobacteria bacterium]|nr:TIGR00730 family Rossman fold protein [Alphaproteobacteria bacterium]